MQYFYSQSTYYVAHRRNSHQIWNQHGISLPTYDNFADNKLHELVTCLALQYIVCKVSDPSTNSEWHEIIYCWVMTNDTLISLWNDRNPMIHGINDFTAVIWSSQAPPTYDGHHDDSSYLHYHLVED